MDDTASSAVPVDRIEPVSAEALLPLVYDELRRLAAHKLGQEPPTATLQATALVHEAWLRLEREGRGAWANRREFFAAAAEAMRRILVEHARRRLSLKRGGASELVPLEESRLQLAVPPTELLAVHEALERLAAEDPEVASLVKLRYFVGMTMPEAAEALGVSPRTAERWWTYARAWLRKEIAGSQSAASSHTVL